ncbi:hypothetical protein GA0074692_6107 [Micromonospora pallida]|uniref:Uncharacterized protein n=1 Tax=Micromonospora pallida TaxID=145854 RepID=A0A1C6THJ5_9ACTN|nr:hypothetical protein [Micromonospora pallida]SCL41033.1 hypothetical protein GA0074692_6107 [Micromonospora pallida]
MDDDPAARPVDDDPAARPVDEVKTRREPGNGSTLVAAIAAAMVGAAFVSALPYLVLSTGLTDLVPSEPLRAGVLGPAVFALAAASALTLYRVTGWLVAAAGLLLVTVADQFTAATLLFPADAPTLGRLVAHLCAAVGLGLAVGGVLLAVGQATRRARTPLAAGLAVGLTCQPAYAAVVGVALFRGPLQPLPAQLWLALGFTLVAGLLAYRRRRAAPRPVPSPLRWTPVVVVLLAGLLVLGGFLVRSWVVRAFRASPDGLVGPRRAQAVETFTHHSTVVIAVVATLALLLYAHRAVGLVGTRWVVLGFAAAPVSLAGWAFNLTISSRRVLLVAVVGFTAVTAGAMVARHAERILPWDALGVAVAAAALPLALPVVREELPSALLVGPLLAALGLGLALGFGLTSAATRDAEDRSVEPTERGWLPATLVLGFVAWTLTVQALAPIAVPAQFHIRAEPTFTLPVLVGAAALLLVLLFAFGRVVDGLRRDLSTPTRSGPTE